MNNDEKLTQTIRFLGSKICFLYLGSVGDSFDRISPALESLVQVISLDACSPSSFQSRSYAHVIKGVVAESAKERTFIERTYSGCSSLLIPKEEKVRAYGLEDYFRLVAEHTVKPIPASELLELTEDGAFHFIKTDLEGLDFAIIKSLGKKIRDTLVLQMELRFEPFFEGEPHFHEVAYYLGEMGFEAAHIACEEWRYNTKYMLYSEKGRTPFCNALFINGNTANMALGSEKRSLCRQ